MDEIIELLTEMWVGAKKKMGKSKEGIKEFHELDIDLQIHLDEGFPYTEHQMGFQAHLDQDRRIPC